MSLAAIASTEASTGAEIARVAAVAPAKKSLPVLPSVPKPAAWRVLTEPATAAASASSWAR